VADQHEQVHCRMNAGNIGEIRAGAGRGAEDVQPLCPAVFDLVAHDPPRVEYSDRASRAEDGSVG